MKQLLTKQKQVLIVNDDGITSIGLHSLAGLFNGMGWDVTIVAPAKNQSGKSFSLTFDKPVKVLEYSPQGLSDIPNLKCYKVYGTPLDCVNLGLNKLIAELPDLIVSGINAGANVSFNIAYSGTVSAAIEGARHKIPSIAISVDSFTPERNLYAKAIVVLKEFLDKYPLDYRKVCNINIPDYKTNFSIIETSVLEGSPKWYYEEIKPGYFQLMEGAHDLSAENIGHLPSDVETLRNGNVSLSILPIGE